MPAPRRPRGPLLRETREHWPLMNYYERFERVVAFILGLVISLVIVLAVLQLVVQVVPLLLSGAIDPLDHEAFQGLFGMVMTVLIALEFKHSIIRVALRRESIVQVKTVISGSSSCWTSRSRLLRQLPPWPVPCWSSGRLLAAARAG